MPNQENFDYHKNNLDVQDDEYISGDNYHEQLQNLQTKPTSKFSWQQKISAGFLVIFGVSALILWAAQFKSGLQVTKPLSPEELAQLNQSQNP